jgi:hypothetical protein
MRIITTAFSVRLLVIAIINPVKSAPFLCWHRSCPSLVCAPVLGCSSASIFSASGRGLRLSHWPDVPLRQHQHENRRTEAFSGKPCANWCRPGFGSRDQSGCVPAYGTEYPRSLGPDQDGFRSASGNQDLVYVDPLDSQLWTRYWASPDELPHVVRRA